MRANFGSHPFAYVEGQAHRNAADLCIDLAEEISANFEALPFAMASDSDNDAGTSTASDPGTHGPPCRIAAVATAQQREAPLGLPGPRHCLPSVPPPPPQSKTSTTQGGMMAQQRPSGENSESSGGRGR